MVTKLFEKMKDNANVFVFSGHGSEESAWQGGLEMDCKCRYRKKNKTSADMKNFIWKSWLMMECLEMWVVVLDCL